MLGRKNILLLAFLFISLISFSIPYEFHTKINWKSIQEINIDNSVIKRISFEDAYYQMPNSLPMYINRYPIHTSSATISASLKNEVYIPVTENEKILLSDNNFNVTNISVSGSIIISQRQPYAKVSLLPFRWNDEIKQFEKLIDFDVVIEVTDKPEDLRLNMCYAENSVFSTGDWYKIRVTKSGIYKITYNELVTMGFDVASNPNNIAIYGNGGGLLPEKNDDTRYDDLFENPIVVVGSEDGSFDPGDYLLFYGEGPVVWKYNSISNDFNFKPNYYKDYTYYFITTKSTAAKRIQNAEVPSGAPDIEINDFDDYAVHDVDERNIASVGRTWFGETFDYTTTYEFEFDFPNIKKVSNSGSYRSFFAARAFSSSAFKIYINNQLEKTANMSILPSGERYQYAKSKSVSFNFAPVDDKVVVKTTYQRASNSSVGFLDFIEINVERNLVFSGNEMIFRKIIVPGYTVAKYNISQASQNVTIWDITTPVNPAKVVTQTVGASLTFNADATSFHQYIAFNSENYLASEFVEKVENQNLHSYRNIDYLIVTHPEFLAEADSLANFHRTYNNLNVLVATTDQIYNEFSSGGQDLTAIRDFAKRLYDYSDPGKAIKYLLLFGDASYDYKDIKPDNSNFVPCWESVASLNVVNSIASDDYYGFLDDGEGVEGAEDLLDIGIGRFVVKSVDEAKSAIDKTIHYSVNSTHTMGPWRNMVTFIADDGDNNLHLRNTEKLAMIFDTTYPVYNINKIYLDAYEQIPTPSGEKAPDVNRAINQRIDKGTLIFNYSGHGGETGLGHEQIVQLNDILSWKNYNNLTVFITATCEFTRYDDPDRISAGEEVFLNNKGGGIALFTTSRATYASSNLRLNRAIFKNNMFEKVNGEYPRFGDIIRNSKTNGTPNDQKFLLVGDPACRMAYPEYNAETVKINSQTVSVSDADTINALQLVRVEGTITDADGNKLNNFNGELFSSVYDKKNKILTYGNGVPQYTFFVRNNIIFNGKSSIVNGDFKFQFMVPKDIGYKYGLGKISYYLRDAEQTDGNGYFENIMVGGLYKDAKPDTEGPIVELFMNDTTFMPGDITNNFPTLLAYVSDSSGINTTGNGIGHDIVTKIDEDAEQMFVLNDYYQANENSYNTGVITYPFDELSDGRHTLSLKVWDVYNNSTIEHIDFLVVSANQLVVNNVMNYPNPFVDKTNFVFNHNQSGNEVEIIIEIYSLDGKLVKTLGNSFTAEGYRSEPTTWDGTMDNGGKIRSGFYVYNITVRNKLGAVGNDQNKLLYIR